VRIAEFFERGREALGRVVVGNDEAIDGVLAALVLEGHVLLEGPPGTAKTLLARSLAHVTGLDFARIQFTPT
jgi:MoxR-like ATPase